MARVRPWLHLLPLLAAALTACDDEEIFLSSLQCNVAACDPACAALREHPPDEVKSSCAPPGPICDYVFDGSVWEYACGNDLHIHCSGSGCPTDDLGVRD